MSAVFWIVTMAMTVLAFAFLAPPLFRSNRRKTIIALAIALPLLSAGLYILIGSPQIESNRSTPTAVAADAADAGASQAAERVASVASMVDGLAARLKEKPDDGKGWLLLARSYKHLNRTEDAAHAYSQAVALGVTDPEFAALGSSFGVDTETAAQILGNLRLSEKATNIVLPTDTVFIFARAANGAGVPAAVLQRPASDLPLDFLLNDSQSMVGGVKLSDFDEVVVTARISRSGDATEALQGLEAKSGPIAVTDQKHINLTIE